MRSQEETEKLQDTLRSLKAQKVRVVIVPDGYTRNHFGPQIAVCAPLEIQDFVDGPHYRVLLDEENFSYFQTEDIVNVLTSTKLPTITLSIPVEDPLQEN